MTKFNVTSTVNEYNVIFKDSKKLIKDEIIDLYEDGSILEYRILELKSKKEITYNDITKVE